MRRNGHTFRESTLIANCDGDYWVVEVCTRCIVVLYDEPPISGSGCYYLGENAFCLECWTIVV